MTAAVKIEDLTKSYGKARGIANVNLSVEVGEIFGFIGPNGAGKTTTIRTLLGFLRPTGGRAEVFGLDAVRESKRIKQSVGYLPADVNYYDDMTAGDLLDYSARFYGGDRTARVAELAERFELDLNKRFRSLSTGNRKKTGIIQALLHEPRLLILDEPTGGLDPLMQNLFFDVLREENEKGVTIFFSSHILSEVQRICDRVAIIREGRIVAVEHIDELRSKQYKRVRVRPRDPSDLERLRIPGRRSEAASDDGAEYLYRGDIDELVKELSRYEVEGLWIEDPPLEEIFLHYYEGEGQAR